ncbi:MAG: hypothetical protein CMJ49_13800 [Planctomycetaceae bacterium]|nr:hypothetical protein [Planctomycetaceae bacterium]
MIQTSKTIGHGLALAILLVAASACGAADPIYDLDAILAPPLDARVLKVDEADDIVIEQVMFHSHVDPHVDGGNKVDIFALFAYPKGARDLPAFIWNQSGLAQASDYFPKIGAKRGYAVLCIDFPQAGYRSTGGYLINGGLSVPEDPQRAPIYHGAVALLRAVSYLESRDQVDPDRIGMAGSSWGGFYTTMMAGIDPRLKVASAMFGCGSLQLGNSWWDGQGPGHGPDPATRERWRTTLDPAWRLPTSKVPIGWFTGTQDGFYRMPALMKTYEMAGAQKPLSLTPNWDHGLPPQIDEQVFAWLDVHLKGAPGFPKFQLWEVKIKRSDKDGFPRRPTVSVLWEVVGPRKIVAAEINYSYGEAGSWSSRYWITKPVQGDILYYDSYFHRNLPSHVFGSVIDEDGFRYSTPIRRVEPYQPQPDDHFTLPPLKYDGVSQWGDFEPPHVDYLRRMAYMNAVTNTDAHTGAQSAQLKPGSHRLGPLLYTPGLPHRFTAYLKSETPAEVTIKLAGHFDGQPTTIERTITVNQTWTPVSLDITPPVAVSAHLSPHVTVPAGATVLIDAVTFQPHHTE